MFCRFIIELGDICRLGVRNGVQSVKNLASAIPRTTQCFVITRPLRLLS